MSEVDMHRRAWWTKELLAAVGWTVLLAVALFVLFAMLGGFHGSGGKLLSVATAPIGLLHWMGVGDGTLGAISALVFEFGSMLACVLIVRAVWRKFSQVPHAN
jgi:hypothetical protein